MQKSEMLKLHRASVKSGHFYFAWAVLRTLIHRSNLLRYRGVELSDNMSVTVDGILKIQNKGY